MPGRFLSVKEFAYEAGWSEDTIRRLIYRGKIKAVILPQFGKGRRPYRSTRVHENELKRFMQQFGNEAA